MEQLIDGDLASNNGGWQWSASTGTVAELIFCLSPDGPFQASIPALTFEFLIRIHRVPRYVYTCSWMIENSKSAG